MTDEFADIKDEDTPEVETAEQEQQAASTAEAAEEIPDIETLQSELADWQAKAGEYLDGWQRARAEFSNYKKRVEREQTQTYQQAAANVIKKFLDVADDLERALKNRPEGEEGAAWAGGVELIYRKLLALIEAEGLSRMQAEGQEFDPSLHEAISSEDHPEFESGQIIEVVKHGYLQGERVIRPALVRVAR